MTTIVMEEMTFLLILQQVSTVYRNNSSSVLSFILSDSLLTNNTSGQNIYVSPIDIPAITDVDSDGDLDILTFEIVGDLFIILKTCLSRIITIVII